MVRTGDDPVGSSPTCRRQKIPVRFFLNSAVFRGDTRAPCYRYRKLADGATSNDHPAPSRDPLGLLVKSPPAGLGRLVKSPPAGQAETWSRYDGREGIAHRTHERKPALLQPTQARAAVTRRKREREMESGFVATSRCVIAAFGPRPC